MNDMPPSPRSVVIERELPYPPGRVWRALTQPHLIEEWLMKNDFQPTVGHTFALTAEWGAVACRVLEVEPQKTLSYTWAAMGIDTVVKWTLTANGAGTHLRMEQSGFLASHEQAFQGATYGWQRFLGNLEQVVGRMES